MDKKIGKLLDHLLRIEVLCDTDIPIELELDQSALAKQLGLHRDALRSLMVVLHAYSILLKNLCKDETDIKEHRNALLRVLPKAVQEIQDIVSSDTAVTSISS